MTLFESFKKPQEGAKDAILAPNLSLGGSGAGWSDSGFPLLVKEGVKFESLRPELYSIFHVISTVFNSVGKSCVITSANDSKHKFDSKHYINLALDLRSKHLLDLMQKQIVLGQLREKLGPKYQVLFENEGTESEHYHLAWLD